MPTPGEDFTGTCSVVECLAGAGGPCLREQDLIECDNFEPSPDQHFDGTEPEPDTPLEHAAAASLPESEPAATAKQADPKAPAAPMSPDTAEATVGFNSRVPPPEGPRGLVQLGEPTVAVHSADALSDDEVRDLMATVPVSVVVIAGTPWAGKTTILATLYQQFNRAPIGAWSFAGSRSLRGFAVRSFWSDSASGASSPTTARTNYDITRPWLHLRLARGGTLFDMVIADVSGEHFGPFGGGGPLGPVETYFRRADHVVHLLDAALLGERRDRARAMAASQRLLRRFGESDVFHSHTRHTMVISKVDACDPEVVDSAEGQAAAWLGRWFSGSTIVRVAARPHDDEPPRGLEALLDAMVVPATPPRVVQPRGALSKVGRRLMGRQTRLHSLVRGIDELEAPTL